MHVHWNTLKGFCYAYLLSARIGGKQCAWVLIYCYAFKYFCNVYLTFEHSHWDQIFVMYCNNLVVKWYIEHALECGVFQPKYVFPRNFYVMVFYCIDMPFLIIDLFKVSLHILFSLDSGGNIFIKSTSFHRWLRMT